jgi:hypothetical protein
VRRRRSLMVGNRKRVWWGGERGRLDSPHNQWAPREAWRAYHKKMRAPALVTAAAASKTRAVSARQADVNVNSHARRAVSLTTHATGGSAIAPVPMAAAAVSAAAAGMAAADDGGWREARAEDRTPALVGGKIKVFWDDESGPCTCPCVGGGVVGMCVQRLERMGAGAACALP